MQVEDFGYDRDRFTNLPGESFSCIICSQVVIKPKECTNCGSLFCGPCIDSWHQKRNDCPNRCANLTGTIRPIQRALMRVYNELDIKCKYYNECNTILKIPDLEAHEKTCNMPKCANYEICGNHANPSLQPFKACDNNCLLLLKIKTADGDWNTIYKEVHIHMRGTNPYLTPQTDFGITDFKWDNTAIGKGIELAESNTRVFLKEGPYIFRSVIGDQGFTEGVHYWEIQPDPRTENELKIGVVTRKDFNLNTAFCDSEIGFGYYGVGETRNGSATSGVVYGKKFRNSGLVRVFLDMDKGTLSFALNDDYFGVAFKSEKLKKGPIYPAVALLHCGGCKLVTGNKAPQCFL